jgi:hypothetical protein
MQRSPEPTGVPEASPVLPTRHGSRILFFALFVVVILVLWELVKFIGGDPWRYFAATWRPPRGGE